MDAPLFPNYMQMTPRVPRRFWDALRALSLVAGLGLCVSLIVWPQVGLFVLWGVLVPLLPLLFFIAPGFWRNICPLAASNQVPRRFGFTRARTLHPTLRAYGFLVPIALFLAHRSRTQGPFQHGRHRRWCTAARVRQRGVPRWPRLQREERMVQLLLSAACRCSACTGRRRSSSCGTVTASPAWAARRIATTSTRTSRSSPTSTTRIRIAAHTGRSSLERCRRCVLAFYTVDAASGWHIVGMYGTFGLYILGGIGAFFVLDSVLRVSTGAVAVVFGAAALDLYYWFTWPYLAEPHRRLVAGMVRMARAHRRLGAERRVGRAHAAEGAPLRRRSDRGAAGAPRRRRRGCAGGRRGERRARRDDRSRRHAHCRLCPDRRYSTSSSVTAFRSRPAAGWASVARTRSAS